jgi:phosphate transport system protein
VTTSYLFPSDESPQFKRKSRRLEQDVLRMGALVENTFRLAHQGLFHRNLSAIKDIAIVDVKIDQFYRQIEWESAQLMTLGSPVAQDLRLLSAFMQMVRDLERIGDYAKDLGEIAIKLFPYNSHPCMEEIAQMSLQGQMMLGKSLAALSQLDENAGESISLLDDVVDRAYANIYETLAHQENIIGPVEPILLMCLIIRHLERMADHATNVAHRVTYIVTGKFRII